MTTAYEEIIDYDVASSIEAYLLNNGLVHLLSHYYIVGVQSGERPPKLLEPNDDGRIEFGHTKIKVWVYDGAKRILIARIVSTLTGIYFYDSNDGDINIREALDAMNLKMGLSEFLTE